MRVFVALGVLTLLQLPAFGQSAGPLQPTGPAAGQGVLPQAALVHQLLVSRDPSFVAEQVHAFQLHRQGRSEDQIVAETQRLTREWRVLKSTTAWDVSGEAIDIARALGRYADHLRSGGPTDQNRAIQYLEAKWQGIPVPRAARKWVDESGGSAALADEVFGPLIEAYRAEPSFRSVWDRLFQGRYGFTPASTDLEVLASYIGFAGNERLATLTTEPTTTTELMDALSTATAQVVEATREVATIRRTPPALVAQVSRQNELRHRVNIANAYALADVTSTLLAAIEPEVGRRLKVTTTAVIEIHHSFERLHAAERAGANMSLARMVFTGNLIGIAVKAFTSLFSSGPSPHEIVVREIGKLRQQVATLRHEVHHRFNGVHKHIQSLNGTILNVYNAVAANQTQIIRNQWRLFDQQLGMLRELRQTAAHVRQMTAGLIDIGSIIVPEDQQPPWMAAHLAPCRREYRPADGDLMTVSSFLDCLSEYGALVNALPAQQLHVQAIDMQTRFLQERPGRSLQIAYNAFLEKARALGPAAPVDVVALPDKLVSPADWVVFASIVDDIIAAHSHTPGPETTVTYAAAMRQIRNDIFAVLGALLADLGAFHVGNSSVLGAILADVSSTLDAIDDEINRYRDEYYRQQEYAGRVDASGQPELRVHEGPYAWSPLWKYEANVPPWIQFSTGSDTRCPLTMEITGQDVPLLTGSSGLRSWLWLFKQGMVDRFVNADDLAVVRSGHGRLSVCLYYRDMNRRHISQFRTGVFFLFEPVDDDFCEGRVHVTNSQALLAREKRSFEKTANVERGLLSALHSAPARPRLPASCHAAYEEAFQERQESLSAFIRGRLSASARVDEAHRSLAYADALLKRLVALTFEDWLEVEPVSRLINGDIGIPVDVTAADGPAWELVEHARERLDGLKATLRSREFGELLALQPAHELLADTSYRYIDE